MLVLLPLVVTLVLGAAYLHRAGQHRRAVEEAARELAATMLREVLQGLDRDIRRSAVTAAAAGASAVTRQQVRAPGGARPAHALEATLAVLDSANHCACGPVLPYRGVFVTDADRTWIETRGPSLPPGPRILERLSGLSIAPAAGTRAVLQSASANGPDGSWLAFVLPWPKVGEPWLVGIEVDLERFGAEVVAPVHDEVAGRWFEGDGAFAALGVEVRLPSGPTLYRAGVDPRAAVAVVTLPLREAASWQVIPGTITPEVSASLAPEALADLIPGGMPGSPVPLVVATLLITTGVTALGLHLQARRRALLRLREDFVSSVSHELRTPLAQILLYGETLLIDEAPPDTHDRAADVIVREARRLIHMVESSLSFVRNQRPETGFDPARLDLLELARTVAGESDALARQHRASIRVEAGPAVTIRGDRRILRTMMTSLLENAIRYGPDGQEVRVDVTAEGDEAIVRVDDQGPGIPADEREAVWRPFQRGSTAGLVPGSGIGLALVRQGVALHEGRARIATAPGGGARFELRFPRDGGKV